MQAEAEAEAEADEELSLCACGLWAHMVHVPCSMFHIPHVACCVLHGCPCRRVEAMGERMPGLSAGVSSGFLFAG